MSTTYSEPKEMLGYIVVKFIDQQLPILQNVPYDRRATFAFYYQLKGLDSQLVSFRSDMFIIENEKKYKYDEVMTEIKRIIKEQWESVYAKEYELFMGALFKWSELIASCYPKLGLVPESKEIVEPENIVKQEDEITEEMEEDNLGNNEPRNEPNYPTMEKNTPVQSRKTGFRLS